MVEGMGGARQVTSALERRQSKRSSGRQMNDELPPNSVIRRCSPLIDPAAPFYNRCSSTAPDRGGEPAHNARLRLRDRHEW